MADYKGIKGFKVQSLASDPSNAIEGQVWYNTTTNLLKYTAQTAAWVSGGNMNTVRTDGSGFGALATAQGQAGASASPTVFTLNCEQYDGTSWSEVNNMLVARRGLGAVGTQTAGIAFSGSIPGGANSSSTENWNGSSWSEVNNQNTAGNGRAPVGTVNTAALAVGFPYGIPPQAATEEYDGTSWSTVGSLNDGRGLNKQSAGITTAGLVWAGDNHPASPRDTTNCEEYNGTAWSEVNNCINSRRDGAGVGLQNAAISFGGNNNTVNPVPNSEEYDGTSWANTTNSPAAPRLNIFSNCGGTSTAALQCTGALTNTVEEYALAPTTKTVTVS